MVLVLVMTVGGCKAQGRAGLGDGPPAVDANTQVLAPFKPGEMAGPGAGGLDLGAVAGDPPAAPEVPDLPAPKLLEFGPIGDTGEYANIEFRFNRPVVPLGERDRLDPKALGLDIQPKLEGELYFAEPDRLVFAPADALPLAHVWQVRLDAKLQAVDGPAFSAKADFSFATTAPTVTLWPDAAAQVQAERGAGDIVEHHFDARVFLDASDEVSLGQLRRHVRAEAIDARGVVTPVAIVVRKGKKDPSGWVESDFEIHPKTHWPAGREILIRVGEGLVGRLGPRPMGREESLSFAVAAGVRVVAVDCYAGDFGDGCDLGPLQIRFSAPVTRAQASRVSVSPTSKGFDTLAYDRELWWDDTPRNAYWSILAWGDYSDGGHYKVSVDPKLRDIHGQILVGESEFEIDFVEPPPELSVHNGAGTLVHSNTPRAGIETRHAEQLRLRVAVLDDETLERMLHAPLSEIPWPSEGAKSFDERITPVHQGKFGFAATELDFHRFTGSKPGAVLFEASVTKLLPRAANRSMPAARRGLVQISDLGVSVIGSLTDSWVRVADVSSDKPVRDAQIELIELSEGPGGKRRVLGQTDAAGLLAIPGAAKLPEGALLRVRKGDDKLLVSIAALRRAEPKPKHLRVGETTKVAVTTERALYRPGEVVRAIGWATVAGPYELAGVRPLSAKATVTLELRDPRNEVVATRTVAPKRRGKFWATLPIPASAGLGNYSVTAKVLDGAATAAVEVKDFVAPEFEVSAQAARTDLHHGETTTVDVNARYYFGGPVPIVRMRTTLRCQEAAFRPPGLAPEWRVGPGADRWRLRGAPVTWIPLPATATHGHVVTGLEPHALDPGHPAFCTFSAALADQTQREVGAETSAWFHPDFYLASRVPARVEPASDLDIPIATLDFDGSRLPTTTVEVTLERSWYEEEWVTENGKRVYAGRRERKKKLPVCKTHTLAGDASCRFPAIEHGRYAVEIVARNKHAPGYQPTLSASVYVPEPRKSTWSWSTKPARELSIEVDKAQAKPGEVIRARVSAPWASGAGVVLIAKGAIHEVHRFELDQGAAEFTFTATDAWIPNTELWAAMIQPGDGRRRHPRLATAHTQVSLANTTRNLEVVVDVPREADAGDSLPIVVHARDHANRPIRGHVSVWAVDEAVLALAPHELPNFVDAFTIQLTGGLGFVDGYAALIFAYIARSDVYQRMQFVDGWAADPESALGYGGYGRGSGAGFSGRGHRVPRIRHASAQVVPPARSKFDSAPIFIGDAELDEHGVARLSGELPDNLTTFRVTALVSSPIPSSKVEARFGTADARVRVTRPIVVRAALPRILRPGDSAEVGVLVDNLRAGAGKVEVAVTIDDPAGALELLSPAKVTLAIAAGGQVRVPFEVRAHKTGAPTFTARATLQPDRGARQVDAVELNLPIEAERTLSDRVAVYGTLDADRPVLLPFELPDDADPAFGGLSVSIGSSMLGGVEDAVAYLVGYPHGCVEQTSSSLLPLIPLGSLAKTYPLGIPDTNAYVEAGVARLRTMQLANGGFGYWPGSITANPYASAYAAWVLGRAAAAGYPVPPAMLSSAQEYLFGQVQAWSTKPGSTTGRDIEIALALSTLAEAQRAPSEALAKLHERRTTLPMFARAILLMAIHDQDPGDPRAAAMLAELRSFVDEREASARIETDSTWTWYWDSNVRSSAMMLIAMLALDPEHVLVPKLARGLLDARRGGRWSNTQENAYALIALAEYARIYEADEPNFEGRVWLDRTAVAKVRVQGRSFAFEEGFTGMPALLEADRADPAASRLLLERAGVGRMYYRVGLEWASTAGQVQARSEGLGIERTIRDESGPLAADQAIAAGTLLAMDVVLDTRSELTHVAIELPLPAGLEAIDMGLGKGTSAMRISGSVGWFVSHQELRRDRAVVFADRLPPGTHTHTVWLRATTPGEYVMPPASAQMMYYPEVYGRTASARISVD
ncbi:hypothetical protein DB30_05747 [Enhygromyxa salina]|uniref:MG2 domain protein n=1 Tax=Enhygromyxa salina TaxID=215803 RepID=A0A0C2D0F3_9BACT|nr:hypothetical protein DB30_05747 [Enhygromyxa salina]